MVRLVTKGLTKFCLLSLLLCCCTPKSVTAKKGPNNKRTSSTEPTSKSGGELNDWIRARCSGDKNVALWVYEGALYDPLEGRRIANVEGIELVKCVANVGDSSDPANKQHYQQQCGDLEVGRLISHENATFDSACTILSRKLFCYQSPDDPNQLLTSIRLRPNAPLRTIPTRQSVATYDTATTFIARGKELIAHTEWPDRQSIWGMATRNFVPTKGGGGNDADDDESNQKQRDSNNNHSPLASFDFTVYARQKSARKKPEQLFDLSQPPVDPSFTNASAVVAAPRRAKLIEFGTSSSRGKDKFGARETYSYSNIPPPSSTATPGKTKTSPNRLQGLFGRRPSAADPVPPCQVRYSRYGEGPPFFGPGRVCSLELQGRRISSLDEVPSLTASLIAQRMDPPEAFNTTTTSGLQQLEENEHHQGIEWFRSSPGGVQVHPAIDEKQDFWLPDYLRDKGLGLWNKLRKQRRKSH